MKNTMPYKDKINTYTLRVNEMLEQSLPNAELPPRQLHEAMRYSVLGGGKRVRPLLVYATGEALGIESSILDAPAAAIELMHAFSLVHDDLPAMDDDDLRRGQPTVHIKFNEATAILAADALQPLAFEILAETPAMRARPEAQRRIISALARACGSNGMTGGQSIDLASEAKSLNAAELEHMYRLKTGRLLWASVMSAAYCDPTMTATGLHSLERFIDALGLAFQIRDDILDIEGSSDVIGKPQGSDLELDKATYPALFGMQVAKDRTQELLELALASIEHLGEPADILRWIGNYIVQRES
jgi:farnesyl diphosphate synthase